MSQNDVISREEARLLRTMEHARRSAGTRPRSWSVNKNDSEYKDLKEQIKQADDLHRNVFHSKISPRHHEPTHLKVAIPDRTNTQIITNKPVAPVPEVAVQAEQLSPEALEEKRKAQERQAKMEAERFARYLGKPSVPNNLHSPKREMSLPKFTGSPAIHAAPAVHIPPSHHPNPAIFTTPTPAATISPSFPKIVHDKSPRVVLEITGVGSTKAEAGKTTSFNVKPKSVVNIAGSVDGASIDLSVKITFKNAEDKVVELPFIGGWENDSYRVTYTPSYIGPHTVEIFVAGQTGHSMVVPVAEGGPYALNTDATYYTLKNATVGNKAQLIVSPMSYIKRLVPLGYSALTAKVDHVESHTSIKNVSVLADKAGHYVVSFYPAHNGDHIISVLLNGEHISGSPFVFEVLG